MRKLLCILILVAVASGQTSIKGTVRAAGANKYGVISSGPPFPTITSFTASSNAVIQGTLVTLSYFATNVASCSIDHGILPSSFICIGTTSLFLPPFSSPGPTCTTYTFTATNASGVAQAVQTICVTAVTPSGDDSRYSTGISEGCLFPGSMLQDGPAILPQVCLDTKIADRASPGVTYAVGCSTSNCSGGVANPGTCTLAQWNSVVASVNADVTGGVANGDTIKIAAGCSIPCPSTGCLLPNVRGNWTHWTNITVADPATGNLPVGFPAEGVRLTPCDAGVAFDPTSGLPDYSADCTTRGGPAIRTAKFVHSSTTAAALTVYQIGAITETCNAANYPCLSYAALTGIEATNAVNVRTSHKLVELAGADHVIFDRGYVHGQVDPLFRVEVQGGILINGSHESVINSWIGQIVCANAPVGTTCIDSNGIFWSAGQFPEVGHKLVNNFASAAAESWFMGGAGTGYYPTASNPDGGASDSEVRRNQSYHPLTWFLPYLLPTFTVASVDAAGNYSGSYLGCVNNACVGKTEILAGFLNAANNIAAPGALVTASTNTVLSFGTTTVPEVHAATAKNSQPHWDIKNLGESKGDNRALWEGNVFEYSWGGFQGDQLGFAALATPKSQDKLIPPPSGICPGATCMLFTGTVSAGHNLITCTVTGGGSCSGAGKIAFTCESDPNAIPDWTGAGTTVASCGNVVGFSCSAGTAQIGPFTLTSVNGANVYTGTITGGAANAIAGWTVFISGFTNAANGSTVSPRYGLVTASTATTFTIAGPTTVAETTSATATGAANPSCPGSYAKICGSKGDINHCAVINPPVDTSGNYYHILHVNSSDQVEVVENATALVNATVTVTGRGANPFAAQRNWTFRNNRIRHVANGIQVASAQGDSGTNARGVHNVSIHDNEVIDQNPGFWNNSAGNIPGCCNSGEFIEILSGTTDPNVVPSFISAVHNTDANIGYASSAASGLAYILDTRCAPPFASAHCAAGNSPAYMQGLEIRDNITGSALHVTGNGSNFSPSTQANVLPIYGCAVAGTSGCDFNVQKNLITTGIWPGQINALPNLNLLGSNTVEACSCTTVANGGTCTPGTPPTWSSPVTTGTVDACDRTPLLGYADIFTNYGIDAPFQNTDLQLPSNSIYHNAGSDGADLGANIAAVRTATAGVAFPTTITQININGYFGNTTCNTNTTCTLPTGTHLVGYGVTLSRTTPNGPFTQWTEVGLLPSGVTLSLGGILSGIPASGAELLKGCSLTNVAGDYCFTARAEDGGHSVDTQPYFMHVN